MTGLQQFKIFKSASACIISFDLHQTVQWELLSSAFSGGKLKLAEVKLPKSHNQLVMVASFFQLQIPLGLLPPQITWDEEIRQP